MFAHTKQLRQRGFTYIELIIVTAIMVIVFGAILISFQYALKLGYTTRVKLSALSLANDRMEFFRALPYDDVGVVAGFPTGTISQNSTFVLNGFTIDERVRVDYVDDSADGSGGADSNIITTDYKQIKVEYTWSLDGSTNQLSLVSNIVPRSIETNVGGGTIRVNVLDADSTFLPGASVQVLSSSSTFSYDVTNISDVSGAALFTVPADSDYQTFVTANISGDQYSTSSTYVATTSNPIPVVAPFTVIESGISTLTFQIGALSSLLISTKSSITENSLLETFSDTSGIATSTDTNVSAGQIELVSSLGVHETSGTAYLNFVNPATLQSWETVRVAADAPLNTDYQIQFYTGSTTAYTLIPDTDLPGNSSGFTDTLIDISALDTTLYPTTTIGISFSTTDTSVTPAVQEIEVFWRENDITITGENLYIQGDKTIGTQADATPIYKSTTSVTTDGSGEVSLSDLEFDSYTVVPSTSYSLLTACPAHPFSHQAGIDGELELVYVASTVTNNRVSVVDGLGRAVPGVDVQLQRTGYNVTQTTNTCGQTYFSGGGLSDNTDYTLTVSAPGYITETVTPFEVNGETVETIILTQ